MKDQYDVVIVGGAVIGSAVAYYLAANPDFDGSVLVIERDPTYLQAATSLSSSSIRTQFSNPINVKISQYGSQVIRNFGEMMQVGDDKPDLGFHSGGYLFLANTLEQVQVLKENHEAQVSCGADVVLWNGNPLSVYSRPEKVWIDGALMFDADNPKMRPVSDFELGQPGEGDVK